MKFIVAERIDCGIRINQSDQETCHVAGGDYGFIRIDNPHHLNKLVGASD